MNLCTVSARVLNCLNSNNLSELIVFVIFLVNKSLLGWLGIQGFSRTSDKFHESHVSINYLCQYRPLSDSTMFLLSYIILKQSIFMLGIFLYTVRVNEINKTNITVKLVQF